MIIDLETKNRVLKRDNSEYDASKRIKELFYETKDSLISKIICLEAENYAIEWAYRKIEDSCGPLNFKRTFDWGCFGKW